MAINGSVTFPALSGYTDMYAMSATGVYEHSKSASTTYSEYSGYDRCVIDGIDVGTNTVIKETITESEFVAYRSIRYQATFSKTYGLTLSTHFITVTSTSSAAKVIGATAYTTEATFSRDFEGYYNADGVKVPDNWATSTVYAEPFGAPTTFTHYLDPDGNPLKGYSLVSTGLNDSDAFWMADSKSTLEMYDEGIQLKCIRKGCAPLFQAWYNGQQASLPGKIGGYISASANPTTNTRNYNPFYVLTSGSEISMVRTDDQLTIGSATFSPSDFRDGVIPEFMYILAVGGGAGGGGTKTYVSKGAGGGGAGGCIGAVVNLKESYELKLEVGTGGSGGTSSSTAGSAGGNTYVNISATIPATGALSFSSAGLTAYGGKGGNNAQVAGDGGSTGYTSQASGPGPGGTTYYSKTLLNCISSASGGKGSAGNTSTSTAGTSTMTMYTTTTFTTFLTNAYYHSRIWPIAPGAGSDGSTDTTSAGGGGSSIIGYGGDGKKQANGSSATGKGAGGGGAGGQAIGGGYTGGSGSAGAILFFY